MLNWTVTEKEGGAVLGEGDARSAYDARDQYAKGKGYRDWYAFELESMGEHDRIAFTFEDRVEEDNQLPLWDSSQIEDKKPAKRSKRKTY